MPSSTVWFGRLLDQALTTIARYELSAAIVLVALVPVAAQMPARASLEVLIAIMITLIAFEAFRFADVRERVRHEEDIAVSELAARPSSE